MEASRSWMDEWDSNVCDRESLHVQEAVFLLLMII
jgi:hypothetical protein